MNVRGTLPSTTTGFGTATGTSTGISTGTLTGTSTLIGFGTGILLIIVLYTGTKEKRNRQSLKIQVTKRWIGIASEHLPKNYPKDWSTI